MCDENLKLIKKYLKIQGIVKQDAGIEQISIAHLTKYDVILLNSK